MGCVCIATGFVFYVEKRKKQHARMGSQCSRVVDTLGVTTVTGMIVAALGILIANWLAARKPSRAAVRRLRVLGALSLGGSLALCLWVDHASMASLVWVMALAGSALAVAFTLTWRPGWLRLLARAGGLRR